MSPPEAVEAGPVGPPSYQLQIWAVLGAAIVLLAVLLSVRFAQNPDSPRPGSLQVLPPDGERTLLAEPEMDDEYWPCSDCHDGEPSNPTVREMEDEHDEIPFDHGTTWCLDCHDTAREADHDTLHLASGVAVSFDETSTLCLQCHGPKRADWEAGVHGKQTGSWRGDRTYRPCVSCHSPHTPGFVPLEPLPAPLPTEQLQLPGTTSEVPSAPEEDDHEQ